MDILLVTGPCSWIQRADQPQELWGTRLKAIQVLHRIRNVRSVLIFQLAQVATFPLESWTQYTHFYALMRSIGEMRTRMLSFTYSL